MLPARAAWALGAGTAAAGFGLDLLTKQWALATLDPQHPPVLLGGLLTLQLIRNPGAAFSMGENFTVVLSLISIAALLFVAGWLLPKARHRGWVLGSGLLLAGILGNLTDRLFREPGFLHGHVIDFLQLPHFAIFNVADMCITFAAVLVVWQIAIAQVDLDGRSTKETGATKASGGSDAGRPPGPEASQE
ncbi:signal peptidase II [Propioniciclava sp.]|uniref:signal peptidase II n=1 Tax=Propioniciclava sp. TaxID=2038686 RepID=UPI0039E3AB45